MGFRRLIARRPSNRSAGSATIRGRLYVGVLAILLVLAISGLVIRGQLENGHATRGSTAAFNADIDPGTPLRGRPAPNFTLTNQFNAPTSLSQFRGKIVVLAFVDSECTSICPLTTMSMLQAKSMLGAHASDVQLIGINANPIATSVADVSAYSTAHAMTNRWDFLTGSRAQLSTVWHEYNVYVAAIHGNIDHEPAIYIIGPHGGERMLFLTQMAYANATQQAQLLADAVAALLPGHPKLPKPVSLKALPVVRPEAELSLPVVGGDSNVRTVRIGPGHPHLLVFFATWLQETSNLTNELTNLNHYAAAARRHGWPSLVLIDETTTEPSPNALADFLHRRMKAHLDYPITVDSKGLLADGYGVQNLPCTILTSATGHLLFTNQDYSGWPPIDGLEAAVGHAVAAASGH